MFNRTVRTESQLFTDRKLPVLKWLLTVFRSTGANQCTDLAQIWQDVGDRSSPTPCQIDPNQHIFGDFRPKPPRKIANFLQVFRPTGATPLTYRLFMKFARFMCDDILAAD